MKIQINSSITEDSVTIGELLSKGLKGVKATMTFQNNQHCLTILCDNNYEICFTDNGLSSGYGGEGPNGTVSVLELFGFSDIKELVFTKDEFEKDMRIV